MRAELSPLFDREVSPAVLIDPDLPESLPASTTAASSTPESAPGIIDTAFKDRVVENRDARVIENAEGTILLLWTFLDRRTILITTNEATLREVISRMAVTPIQYQP
jgi:hypothetical protein